MWFVVGMVVGAFSGVLVISLMHMARDVSELEGACTGKCNQGRECTCWPLRHMTDADFDKAHEVLEKEAGIHVSQQR